MNWIEKIRKCFESNSVFYSQHAKLEMRKEEFGRIVDGEVYEAVLTGEIIEEYPEDRPYPSVLIYGKTKADRPIHIVCSLDEEESLAIVVTVYEPDPDRWIEFRKRR